MKQILSLVFVLMVSLLSAKSYAAELLEWAPPEQTQPAKISVDYDEDPAFIKVTTSVFPYRESSDRQIPVSERVTIELRDDEDAIIDLPKDKTLMMTGLGVNGGHNVRIIGGHLAAIAPADDSLRGVLRFAGQSASVFAEGLIVDARNQYGLDGILVGGVHHKPDAVGDVYIQNCLIRGINSTRQGLHADGFQFYGSVKWLHMDRVSIRSQYQGIFLDPQADITGIDLRHVDLDYPDPATGAGYIFYLRNENVNLRHPVVRLKDVYAGERTNRSPWQEFSIYPPESRVNGARYKDGKVSFPSFPEVEGYVTKGAPPSGAYVSDKIAGAAYVSPGYKKSTE